MLQRAFEGRDVRGHGRSDHLDNAFLDRVRKAYRLALQISKPRKVGHIWGLINDRRADVHEALMRSDNKCLRKVFSDPASTDLYYGVENCCRSIDSSADFISTALNSGRFQIARYQVDRLRELGATSVVEIGPGMGRVAYHAFQSGLTDYTTIDLPLGIVAQACFLGAMLGPSALWLEGDDPATAGGRIRLLAARPERRYSVALNSDSITEMSVSVAVDYAHWLSSHAEFFLSINHQSNRFTVNELMRLTRVGKLCACQADPIRPGYVEEIFEMGGAPPRLGPFMLRALVDGRRIRSRLKRSLRALTVRHRPTHRS